MLRQSWRSYSIRHDVPPITRPARKLAGYFSDTISEGSPDQDTYAEGPVPSNCGGFGNSKNGPAVIFQHVVHSTGTREADCAEAISSEEKVEWTSTRMPDLRCAVERS